MMNTRKHITRAVVVAGAAGVVAVGALAAEPREEKPAANPNPSGHAHVRVAPGASGEALTVQLSEDELRKAADVVVRATAVSDDVVPFRANEDVPASARDDALYREGSFHDVRVRVAEYVKGDGPRVLSIRRRDVPHDAPGAEELAKPRVGEEYTLYLAKGQGVWQGGYLVLGRQGMKRAG